MPGPSPTAASTCAVAPFPHARLIAQTLIFFGVARMHVAVGIGFAGLLP